MTTNAKMGLMAAGIAAGLLLVCGGGGLGVYLLTHRGPSLEREGETWTVRDLVSHFEQKGGPKGDNVSYGNLLGRMPLAWIEKGGRRVLAICQLDTAQRAKETAATSEHEAFFSWGRFAISGDKWAVESARRSLGL